MPGVDSGLFNGSLIYLFEHSPTGAGGVIINRPTDIELSELLERFEIEAPDDLEKQMVFWWTSTSHARFCAASTAAR